MNRNSEPDFRVGLSIKEIRSLDLVVGEGVGPIYFFFYHTIVLEPYP